MTRAEKKALKEARAICALEFEPLWRPAPWITPRPASPLEAADRREAAKQIAFAWLAARMDRKRFSSFDEINSVEQLRLAYALIWNATILDCWRWADAMEAA